MGRVNRGVKMGLNEGPKMEMNPKICIYMGSCHGFHYITWVVGEERNSWEVTI